MNIEDIKKRMESNNLLPSCDLIDLSSDVEYLLSIIEQAEEALDDIANSKYLTIVYARKRAEEALQAIRKGD